MSSNQISMVHSIFHVWGDVFAAKGPLKWQSDYAGSHVYGIDFDLRSVKIARALNLIAGDGKTNVYKANTLDPKTWSEEVRVGMKQRLRRFPKNPEEDKWNRDHYRYFDFDVLLTNPPFAGDLKDSRILHQFELSKNPKGKWQREMSRDVLFIERNLEFIRPGGRAAIVLPQGRFNNVSDAYVRAFIGGHARILASVSLHVNTFKPHANIKTSVLFIQKWNDDPKAGALCERKNNYPIFFATSDKPGKDNLGDYTFRIGSDNMPELDSHGHMIVEHDLDGIADAFVAWAESEGLSFH